MNSPRDLITLTKNYAGEIEVEFPEDVLSDRLHPNDIDEICRTLPDIHAPVGESFARAAEDCLAEALQ